VGDPTLAAPLCSHHKGVAAEIALAVRREWALTIGDALLRRTALGLGPCQGLDCVDAVAELMGGLLGWDAERRKREIDAYRREIEPMRRFSVK
jgi:glycerol-3-phosphate dehydrogenase